MTAEKRATSPFIVVRFPFFFLESYPSGRYLPALLFDLGCSKVRTEKRAIILYERKIQMIKFPPVRHTAALVAFACRKGEIELAHPHHPDSADFTWTPHTLVCFAGFCPPVVFLCQCVACIGADHAIAIVQRKNFVTWECTGGFVRANEVGVRRAKPIQRRSDVVVGTGSERARYRRDSFCWFAFEIGGGSVHGTTVATHAAETPFKPGGALPLRHSLPLSDWVSGFYLSAGALSRFARSSPRRCRSGL